MSDCRDLTDEELEELIRVVRYGKQTQNDMAFVLGALLELKRRRKLIAEMLKFDYPKV